MSNSDYTLTAEDLEPGFDYRDPPAIRAAENPNPAVLNAVLRYHPGDSSLASQYGPNAFTPVLPPGRGGGDSPLLRAIRRHLPGNVNTLLEAGADPNGLPTWILSDSVAAATGSLAYQRPDPPGNIYPFWSSAMSHFQVNKLSTQAVVAVEAAAAESLDDTIDQLVTHGADISCWKAGPPTTPLPAVPTPSSLSASSPLHAAIAGRHNATLVRLLSPPLSFNPNFIPLGPPVRRLTPPMQCLCTTPPNLDALAILLAHPLFNAATRTPDFGVHLVHFAAAHLSASLLRQLIQQLPTALRDAGTTSRGHTLLHVACMPRDETYINVFAPSVYQSVRFVSALDPAWKPIKLHAACPQRAHGLSLAPGLETPLFGAQDEGFFDAQVEVLDFLREMIGPAEDSDSEQGSEEKGGAEPVEEEDEGPGPPERRGRQHGTALPGWL
ncbi:ANK-REP-REGION domain-containing protein [Mycena venus]|uniref:ANK-REP-REGION domain-containing protein n=1 Tax=Mycena venus TaxID=2733690 RepID=A0A8H6XIV2_9AGAR|nr:ANK-REP-REGION domain-containing protein [Mycena venus]